MAISDYTLSKLRAAQQARAIAAQTEQARAQREAAQGRQNMAYLNALLQTGAQIPGMIGDIGAKQAADFANEVRLRAQVEAGKTAPEAEVMGAAGVEPELPLPEGSFQGKKFGFDYETPTPTDTTPGTAAAAKLFETPPAPTTEQLADGSAEIDKQVKDAIASKTMLTPELPTEPEPPVNAEAFINNAHRTAVNASKAAAATKTDATRAKTPVSDIERRSAEKRAEKDELAAMLAEQRLASAAGLKQLDIADTSKLTATPEAAAMAPRAIETGAEQVTPGPVTPREKVKAAIAETPIMQRQRLEETLAAKAAETPVPGLKGITVQDISGLLVKEIPQEPVAKKEYLETIIPEIPDFKLQTNIDLSKPRIREAVSKAESYTGFKPLNFANISEEAAAEKIVKEVEEKMPADNPLTAFFGFGKQSGDMQRARRMAKLEAQLIIRETRKEMQVQHMKSFMQQLDATEREEKINLIRAQAALANSKAEKESTVRLKADMPSSERSKLEGYNVAQRSLSNLAEATREVIKEGKGLPIGTNRKLANAYMKANAAKQGSDAASISTSTGLLGGASLSISQAKSGKPLDEVLMKEAFDEVDQSGWTPTQKILHMEKYITIQKLGKALEGGKLTDADYKKYVEILINSDDPQTYLMSINNLMRNNYADYSNYRTSLAGTYEERALAGFIPEDPKDRYFTKDEIANATSASLSPAAAAIAKQGATYRGPGTAVGNIVSDVTGLIQQLAARAAQFEAAGDKKSADIIRQEIANIQKQQAAEQEPAAPGSAFGD